MSLLKAPVCSKFTFLRNMLFTFMCMCYLKQINLIVSSTLVVSFMLLYQKDDPFKYHFLTQRHNIHICNKVYSSYSTQTAFIPPIFNSCVLNRSKALNKINPTQPQSIHSTLTQPTPSSLKPQYLLDSATDPSPTT